MERNAYMKKYRSAYQGGEGEIVEKKSRFIATVQPVESEEEALAFVASMKKKYWNATHNCSAFVVGEHMELQRCSDDGEPQGTAGRPMLDVLLGEEIHNVAVVVTRYFGGTLLGTGGLVRAYSHAASLACDAAHTMDMCLCHRLKICTDYGMYGKLTYILPNFETITVNSDFADSVTLELLVLSEKLSALISEITEITNGSAEITDCGELFEDFSSVRKIS